MRHRNARILASVLATVAALPALGRGTAAGTTIANRADVSFVLNGVPRAQRSNTATVDVAEIVDLQLIAQPDPQLVYGGATAQPLRLTLANIGNGPERFSLAAGFDLTTDDFDPAPNLTTIVFDANGNGVLDSSDPLYQPGTNDLTIPADGSVSFFVLGDIPVAVNDGDSGRVEVRAQALSGTGLPGQSFAGVGNGGVDAVLGAAGGLAVAQAEYLVGEVELLLTKAAAVRDPEGGSLPVSGAAIDYTIQVAASGTGIATDARIVDPVPEGTTYIADSLTVNGSALTDADDTDPGRFDPAADAIQVNFAALPVGAPAQTVRFSVTIN